MRLFKFILSTLITVALVYLLNTRQEIAGNPIPPMGKFLDPFCGFWNNAEPVDSDNAPVDISCENLSESVEVVFDENHVPHIFAKNNEDLYKAQGYIIAMMRLWQMEFQTHAAAGRISELIGEKGIKFDRTQRRKGMVFGAKKTLDEMYKSSETGKLLDAYAEGVNAYINNLNYKDYPIEYKLMDYAPEQWTTLKSALILEYMIDNLTGWDNDIENTNALQLFGNDKFNILYPEWLEGMVPVIPTDSTWGFTPIEFKNEEIENSEIAIKQVIKKPDPDNGSNNWAVSGGKTKSGKPILANDTHLNLNLPSLWILMQLNSSDVNVYGYTFTGALGITIGFNEKSAWGFTNAPRDTRDWYKIKFKNNDKNEYWYDSSWVATSKVIEEIKVRGENPYYDTVVYTHHGPVVYDDSFLSKNKEENNLALRWLGHDASRVQTSLLHLNRAQNYNDYRNAIEFWDAPPQNIIYANTDGDIALTVQGNFPLKRKGQGKFVLDGTTSVTEWGPYIPKAHSAAQHNPERNYVSSANQISVAPDYPYYVYNGSNEAYRNRRINRLLDSMNNITIQDFMIMHNDSYSIKAEEVLPMFLDSLTVEDYPGIKEQLSYWDYTYSADSEIPTYFNQWWEEFKVILWDEFSRSDMALDPPSDFVTTYFIKNYPTDTLIDIVSTGNRETLRDIIDISFINAIKSLESRYRANPELGYEWGKFKSTDIIHLARIPQFSRMDIEIDGHDDAINSTKAKHGPSQRFIIEMTDPPKAWGILPGGQSGNPGSPFYDNFVEQWRDGKYIELIFMQSPQSNASQVKNRIKLVSE